MEELKSRLTRELQQDFNVKIMDSTTWGLPVHSVEIAFKTVLRTKMDILMKMMLIALGKMTNATADELSGILLVEPLFIQDLIGKMMRGGLLVSQGDGYALTAAGVHQLETGIFEHEPEHESAAIRYSPCHEAFFADEFDGESMSEQNAYRYKGEFNDWESTFFEETQLLEALKKTNVESVEGNVQKVIDEIGSVTEVQLDFVPCLEFRLYNQAEDVLYARVWNTLSGHWDEVLEAQLNERELKNWREAYVTKLSD